METRKERVRKVLSRLTRSLRGDRRSAKPYVFTSRSSCKPPAASTCAYVGAAEHHARFLQQSADTRERAGISHLSAAGRHVWVRGENPALDDPSNIPERFAWMQGSRSGSAQNSDKLDDFIGSGPLARTQWTLPRFATHLGTLVRQTVWEATCGQFCATGIAAPCHRLPGASLIQSSS
jgi:hypothetical protein